MPSSSSHAVSASAEPAIPRAPALRGVYQWLLRRPRLKYMVSRGLRHGLGVLPAAVGYRLRRAIEGRLYAAVPRVDELPPIFHYWSNRWLRPLLRQHGCESPQDFLAQELQRAVAGGARRVLSLACGRCELEIGLLRMLRAQGHVGLRIDCVDLCAPMLAEAEAAARAAGVERQMRFIRADVSALQPAPGSVDVVIANQCLHHFVALERIFGMVCTTLAPGGCMLVSDVIGRNGHQLWPESLREVRALWRELPERLRHDHARGGVADDYIDHDHSSIAFEGIRAQDILPLLLGRFDFARCIAWGGIVLPFVERRFGWNFDGGCAEDRALVDRIAQREAALMRSRVIRPTRLLATVYPKAHAAGDGACGDAGVRHAQGNALARAALRDPRAGG